MNGYQMTRKHRCKACQTPCPLQFNDTERDKPEAICPINSWATLPTGTPRGIVLPLRLVEPAFKGEPPEVWGPKLWEELHLWALQSEPDEVARQKWLKIFSARIPICDCKSHWKALLRDNPPPYGGDMFAWTVLAHNIVNKRKGKPELELALAEEKWSSQLNDGSVGS